MRLSPRGTVSARPRRAVLLGNYLRGEARDAIVDAWSAAKVEVVQVGVLTRPTLDVAAAVADADIVVGKGRAVLDGWRAAGRRSSTTRSGRTGGSPRRRTTGSRPTRSRASPSRASLDRDGLTRALDEYDPGMGLVNRDLVLKHHQDRKHTEALVELFRGLGPVGDDRPTAAAELARLSRLRWKAELEAEALRSQVDELTGRLQQAEEALHLSEQRRRRRARAARRAEERLAELGVTVDAAE